MRIRATLIAISPYLGAKFDYGYFIKKFAFGFHDSTQKISSHFEQKWRRDGDLNRENSHWKLEKSPSRLQFCSEWLENFCVESWNPNVIFFKKSKIAKIAVTPSFLLKMTWNFLCKILELEHKKNYKIAIVKFCLYIVGNWNQSHGFICAWNVLIFFV